MNKRSVSGVCAVVVTYNRKKLLEELLAALEQQTRQLDALLVFDNFSSDGTDNMLFQKGFCESTEEGQLHKKADGSRVNLYYRNTQNSGGAGGFHDAMQITYDCGYDYLWVMDDDVLPSPDCLNKLMSYISPDVRICVPCRTDEHFCDCAVTKVNMRNPFAIRSFRKKKVVSNDISGEYIEIQDMPFEGPLIDASLVNEIGLPQKNFFLVMDDTDYAQRALKATKIFYIKNAVLHKQIIPKKDPKRRMDWKDYYSLRNHVWYDRLHAENIFVKYLRPRIMIFDLLLRAVYKRKWSNLKVLKRAYRDGMQGRLGKTIEPGTPGEKF